MFYGWYHIYEILTMFHGWYHIYKQSWLYVSWLVPYLSVLYCIVLTAHTRFLTHIAGVPHVNLNLKCRFAKFVILYTKQSILRMRESLS